MYCTVCCVGKPIVGAIPAAVLMKVIFKIGKMFGWGH